jgi:hypothetical protein
MRLGQRSELIHETTPDGNEAERANEQLRVMSVRVISWISFFAGCADLLKLIWSQRIERAQEDVCV